jgi:heterodisulfide reductase subunit B
MCQASLDLRQQDMPKQSGRRYSMPIVYITQLLGLCLGIPGKELGLNRLMVAPTAILQSLGAKD